MSRRIPIPVPIRFSVNHIKFRMKLFLVRVVGWLLCLREKEMLDADT